MREMFANESRWPIYCLFSPIGCPRYYSSPAPVLEAEGKLAIVIEGNEI